MIIPTTNESVDTPNTVYLLNRCFGLSNGDFYWIRLYSLAPVTVLFESRKWELYFFATSLRCFYRLRYDGVPLDGRGEISISHQNRISSSFNGTF